MYLAGNLSALSSAVTAEIGLKVMTGEASAPGLIESVGWAWEMCDVRRMRGEGGGEIARVAFFPDAAASCLYVCMATPLDAELNSCPLFLRCPMLKK